MRAAMGGHRTLGLALGLLMSTSAAAVAEESHAHCAMAAAKPTWAKTTAHYQVPDVALVRADGARVNLRREIDDGQPVILNFIYTTCTAICPVMSQLFAQVQSRLGDKVHMISVSIDPEQDTPAQLRQYAERVHAGAQWTFYTGTVEETISAQKAFDAYRGDKMNHLPVTFLRVAPGKPWVRLEGFTKADDVVHEYHKLLGTE
jgi:protein SCO1/2